MTFPALFAVSFNVHQLCLLLIIIDVNISKHELLLFNDY